MQVREAMNKDIKVISPDTPIVEVARQMRDGDFGVMPVCEGEKILGMVTDRDIAVRVVADGKDVTNLMVREVMTPEVLTCNENDSLESVAELMADRQIRRLPVVDASQKLVGIISVGDLAIVNQDQASEALGGISEQRHDEPGQTTAHH